MNWKKLESEMILPKIELGCDWSVKRRVLAVNGSIRLFWVSGHMAWAGRGSTGYYPGKLVVQDVNGNPNNAGHVKDIYSGGRCSSKKLNEHTNEIKKLLSVDDLPELKLGETWFHKKLNKRKKKK